MGWPSSRTHPWHPVSTTSNSPDRNNANAEKDPKLPSPPPPEKADQLASKLAEPGYVIHPNVPATTPIITAVQTQLVDTGFLDGPTPLAELHHHLPPAAMALNEHYTNAISRTFYTLSDDMLDAYRDLIIDLAKHVLPEDMIFQARPIIRFHFPVPFPPEMRTASGLPRQVHSDLLGGHPAGMTQGWLALTDCAGSAALQCSTRADGLTLLKRFRESLGPDDPPYANSLQHYYASWDALPGFGQEITEACKPIPMNAGDVLFFDPHCLHGGTENREMTTRVSLDFRLLPVRLEEATLAAATTETQRRFRRGELFAAESTREMVG